MQFNIPDPDYTSSRQARANFRLALKLSFYCLLLLWAIHLLNWGVGMTLNSFGIYPRALAGIPGIIFAPLLHGSFSHLIANSIPLLILATGMLYLYPNSALKVLPIVYLGSGILVWLFARPSIHIGASGVVYGLAFYIFTAGVMRRDMRAIAATMLVYFLYGTMVWGVLPIKQGVSWETHLAAAILGVVLAIIYRKFEIPPQKRYAWEDEDDEEKNDDERGV